jgi:hypothetical protein
MSTVGKTPPLENDVALKLMEARLAQVTISIELLRAELAKLQRAIGEITDVTDVTSGYQKKWKEHQVQITTTVRGFLKHSSYQVKEDILKSCCVRLHKTIGIDGAIFDWQLVLPEDYRLGKHKQVLSINTIGLPGAYSENEPFISWLAEEKFISVEVKINHN